MGSKKAKIQGHTGLNSRSDRVKETLCFGFGREMAMELIEKG